jgi:hypothetical protein
MFEVVIASGAKHSKTGTQTRKLDCFDAQAPRKTQNTFPLPRGAKRPSHARSVRLRYRGRRESRVPAAPAASRAKNKAHERSRRGFAGAVRPSLRNGFNGFLRALSGDRALLSPSSAESPSADLTPASRRQDHTTSPSASAPFVSSTISVHRIPPRVRDDREPPLDGTRRRGL